MRVMILAAGLGTRLRPLTDACPKPLLPLMLQPMLEHWLCALQQQGVKEVVVNVHHHARQFQEWLGDGRRWGMTLTVSHETQILGTAGALKRVEKYLGDAPFVVLNADVLTDLDVTALWHWHLARPNAMVTMALRPDPAARHYGAVTVDAAERVVQINGRPVGATRPVTKERMFTGIQVVSPQVLDSIPPNCEIGTTTEIYPQFIAADQAIYGYDHHGYWMDVGVPQRYRQAHWDMLAGKLGAAWRARLPAGTRVIQQPQDIPPGLAHAGIVPPVLLGPAVRLEAGAQVGPYVVLDRGCSVGAGAYVRDSIFGSQVHIEASASVQNCLLGTGVHITAGSALCDEVRIGKPQA